MVLHPMYPYQLSIGKATVHAVAGILFSNVFPRSFKVVSEWLIILYSCLFVIIFICN